MAENIALNGLPNVEVCRQALWSEDADLVIHSDGVKGEAPQVSRAGDQVTKAFLHSHPVLARSVRSLVARDHLAPPDIVKIDVEGVGLYVLKGLEGYLPRAVFMEVHPTMGEDPTSVKSFLENRGYSLESARNRDAQQHMLFVRG